MKTYPIHPAATLLPLLEGDERAELKRALHDRGQLEPIRLLNVKGKPHVIDGRNRQELLLELGVTPKYISADLRGRTPEQYVVDLNLERRMLSVSQKAALALKLMPELKKAARARQGLAGKTGKTPKGATSAAKQAAKIAKVGTRTIERAIAIQKKAPELLGEIEKGKVTLKQAEKTIRNAEQVQMVKKYVPPEGRFNVITADFSWEYDDKLDGSDAVRGGLPYPSMTIEDIVDFIRGPLAARCDEVCVLGSWITGPMSLDLRVAPVVQREIEALGFKALHERIWKKTRATGGQFVGLGRPIRWDAEKLQLYVRGKVVFNELGEEHGRPIQQTVFEAPVGEHSEKPQRAYSDLEQLVPYTKRLEMFARAPREGWVTTGAEMPEAVAAPAASTSGASQVEAPSFPPPAAPSASPDEGGALSERSDKRAEKAKRISEEYQRLAKTPPDRPKAKLPDLAPLPPPPAFDDPFKCPGCSESFVSRDVLVKHAKTCAFPIRTVDLIAAGGAAIEVHADREAVVEEIARLKKTPGHDPKTTTLLEAALEAYKVAKRETREKRAALRQDDFDNRADSSATQDPISEAPPAELTVEREGYVPPANPASVTQPTPDEFDF